MMEEIDSQRSNSGRDLRQDGHIKLVECFVNVGEVCGSFDGL